MKLVLVPGRALQGESRSGLRHLWTSALHAGFRAAGLALPDGLDLVFPYYGDPIFPYTDTLARDALQRRAEQGAAAVAPAAEEQRFVQEIVLEMALCRGLTPARLAHVAASTIERGVQNWRIVTVALRLLARVPGVDAAWLELFIRDVWCYLTQETIREAVQQVVQQAIPLGESCVVVAHSLGSIVAYDVLMGRLDRDHVRAFITLGSPLGIGSIIERLPTTALARRAPAGVGRWFNARDVGDLVALHDVPAVLFKGHPAVKNYHGVHNNTVNQHGVQDYLLDAVVARAISKAVESR